MPKLLSIEESEKSQPILCIFGEKIHLLEHFLRVNSNKFRIILVSAKKPEYLETLPEIYFLTYKNADLLPRLQEKLDYALLFLTAQNEEYLPSFIEKLIKDQPRSLLVARPLDIKTVLPTVLKLKEFPFVRVAVLDEILTSAYSIESDLSKIIENVILNGEIRLHGNEENAVNCISIKDATNSISRMLFGNFKSSVVQYLFYKHPETILESAHLIVKAEPDTKVIFSDHKNLSDSITRYVFRKIVNEQLGMEEQYIEVEEGFENCIKSLFSKREEIEESVLNRSKYKRISKKKKGKIFKALKFTFLSFMAGGVLFALINLLFLGLGILYLQSALNGIRSGNITNVSNNARVSQFFLTMLKPVAEISLDAAPTILDANGKVAQSFSLLQRAAELSEIAGITFTNLTKSKTFTEEILSRSLADFAYLYQEGQRLVFATDNPELKQQLKVTYSNLLSLSQVLPIVLGFDSPKSYLLLFQNDEELRPTGGFIGSIGDLTIKDGRVENLSIQDVYELDGQLRNHIEPPFVVRRYLQPHLYLRDSNFFLNFQESASKSALLYNLETNEKPNAVIAVNLQVLREILELSGPIDLPQYNVTVSSDTVSSFIQNTIKDNFFPGSTQKRDILNSVFTNLIQKIENDSKFQIELIKLFPELLEKKNILISFSDTSIQRVFSANKYGGMYADSRPSKAKLINDYLYINESNMGVNKVNSDISREVSYRAMIGQDSLTSQATLTLFNSSKEEDYLVYLNVVVPEKSVLRQISINGIVQKIVPAVTDPAVYEEKNFKSPEGLETEQFTKDGHAYFSFPTKALRNAKTIIEIKYENGATKNLSTLVNYSLLYIKQPGTQPYKVKTTFDYPEEYTPAKTKLDSYGNNFMEKSQTIYQDISVDFDLQKRQ